jgi:tetratricopeptide (TPR) repeat protein
MDREHAMEKTSEKKDVRQRSEILLQHAKVLVEVQRYEAAITSLLARKRILESVQDAASMNDRDAYAALLFGQLYERKGKIDAAKKYYLDALRLYHTEYKRCLAPGQGETRRSIEVVLKKAACFQILIRHCRIEGDTDTAATLDANMNSLVATMEKSKNRAIWDVLEKELTHDIAFAQGRQLSLFPGGGHEIQNGTNSIGCVSPAVDDDASEGSLGSVEIVSTTTASPSYVPFPNWMCGCG